MYHYTHVALMQMHRNQLNMQVESQIVQSRQSCAKNRMDHCVTRTNCVRGWTVGLDLRFSSVFVLRDKIKAAVLGVECYPSQPTM